MRRAPRATAGICMVAAAWLTSGCSNATSPRGTSPPAGNRRAQIDSATAAGNASLEPGALATVQAVPVKRWKGPGDRPFEVALRTADSGGRTLAQVRLHHPADRAAHAAPSSQYPCTSCHLGRKVVMADQRDQRRAREHPAGAPGRRPARSAPPATAADDVELLPLKEGDRATLDRELPAVRPMPFRAGGGVGRRRAWQDGSTAGRGGGWSWPAPTVTTHTSRPFEPRIPFRAPHSSEPEATTHEC